jgi:hypothetical protein
MPWKKRGELYGILVLLLAVLAIAPLTYPGFFEVESGYLPTFHVQHLSGDAQGVGNVASPEGEDRLPYLLAWPFLQLTGSGIQAIKWGYGLAFALGALAVYAWTRQWLGNQGAVLASVVYTYLPWHLHTVYGRGAYAESWLWALWPVALWAVDRIAEHRLRSRVAGLLVGLAAMAGAFWTHPGLTALFVPVLVAYDAILNQRGRRLAIWLTASLGLLLAALRLLAPDASGPSFADSFLAPFQLLSAAWGPASSYQLGVASVGLTLVAVALWIARRDESATEPGEDPTPAAHLPLNRAFLFWGIVLAAVLFLTLPLSAPLWKLTAFERFVAWPWQILALAGLPLAYLAGMVIRASRPLAQPPAWAGLIALVILASYPYLAPSFTQVDPGPEPAAFFQLAPEKAPTLALLDYQVAPATEITPTLVLTLTWQTTQPIAEEYTVFVHVLTDDEAKLAQRDAQPCGGECPTATWRPGEIVVDRHELALDGPAVSSIHHLAVGLYLLDTGERVAIAGRDEPVLRLQVVE